MSDIQRRATFLARLIIYPLLGALLYMLWFVW